MGVLSEVGNILKSNIPINKIASDIAGVADRRMVSAPGIRKKMGIGINNVGEGEYSRGGKNITLHNGNFRDDISNTDRLKSVFYNKDGSRNKTAIAGSIAGSYVGISAGARAVTGGGLYRDSEGNFSPVGVPFM